MGPWWRADAWFVCATLPKNPNLEVDTAHRCMQRLDDVISWRDSRCSPCTRVHSRVGAQNGSMHLPTFLSSRCKALLPAARIGGPRDRSTSRPLTVHLVDHMHAVRRSRLNSSGNSRGSGTTVQPPKCTKRRYACRWTGASTSFRELRARHAVGNTMDPRVGVPGRQRDGRNGDACKHIVPVYACCSGVLARAVWHEHGRRRRQRR